MFSKYKKKIIYSIVFGAVVFLGLSLYANFNDLFIAFSDFNWWIFPVVLALSFMNYVIRFFKWEYYTGVLNINVDRKLSFMIFLSSFIMSVTPGKLGEVFKSYLLKEQNGTPVSKSAPIVLAERITDFLSLIFLSIIGAITFNYGTGLLIITGIFFVLLVLALGSKKISYYLISFTEKIKFLSKFSHKVHEAYDSTYTLIQIKPLVIAFVLSLLAWFCECLGFYLVINNFVSTSAIHIDLLVATFIYGFATIAGALTMLPGGLGATDASITGLLVILNIPKNISVASTLIIRVATLWFAVFVGIIAILFYQKLTHKQLNSIVYDNKI